MPRPSAHPSPSTYARSRATFTYNSTFITGNLRTVGDGLFEALSATSTPAARTAARQKFRDLLLIILGFLLGAVLGAFLAPPS